jgi:chromosome segregation ATPase
MTSHAQCATIKYVNASVEALGGELGRKLDAIETKRDRRHESLKEDLRRQGDDIIELKADVAGLKMTMAMANAKLDRHDEKLDLHTATLADHGRKLDLHTATLEDHTATLADHGRKLDQHTATLEEHGQKLDTIIDTYGTKLDQILDLLRAA